MANINVNYRRYNVRPTESLYYICYLPPKHQHDTQPHAIDYLSTATPVFSIILPEYYFNYTDQPNNTNTHMHTSIQSRALVNICFINIDCCRADEQAFRYNSAMESFPTFRPVVCNSSARVAMHSHLPTRYCTCDKLI